MAKEKTPSSDLKIELKTVGDLKDGGYAAHYKINTTTDHDTSNRAEDLAKKSEHSDPFHKCPKCDGTNLFKSLHENYRWCEDCNKLINKSNLIETTQKN